MPNLSFQVESAQAVTFAAAPLLEFKLRVINAVPEESIYTAALRCQIQIEATKRRYSSPEQERLLDLFGEPERWSQTLRSQLWTFSSAVISPFTGSTSVNLPVPCTYDFNVAAAKYFYALEEGEVPLTLLFSGTVFYEAEDGALQVAQIPWDREATYRFPVAIWKKMMDHYYPNSAWLAVHKDVFDRLYHYKLQHGIPTWEQTLESLLAAKENKDMEDKA